MNFLEAHTLASGFAGGPSLPFLFAISGTPDKLDIFFKAAGAKRGRSVDVKKLPFNTLAQTLLTSDASTRSVFVLFPWDLVPEADWRSGIPATALDLATLQANARQIIERLATRPNAQLLYVPASIPPLFGNAATNTRLEAWLGGLVAEAGADLLPASAFSLASYLANGSPFASSHLGTVAELVVDRAIGESTQPKKVLITDLDNVMWRGVIGEDGLDGIHYESEGVGFRHFVYQSLLAKLKREGALLAAVSRNDAELANAPFRSGRMALATDDFVVIVASYHAKSSQIREVAKQLNLGLDSFVFVDDNPIEIEEVSAAIPEIRAVLFPGTDDGLASFCSEIGQLFSRAVVTTEDAERTAMYRRRLEGMVPTDAEGADLTEFLRGLDMALTIHDRSQGDRTRAVQLINKTNQFNLNGRRVTDEEITHLLEEGGRLYTCTLEDRTGSHGEILACAIDAGGTIRSLVMSCRVFQRRVEHAFFTWLAAKDDAPTAVEFATTPRNEPIQQFLDDAAFTATGPIVTLDLSEFARTHASDLALFKLAAPDEANVAGRAAGR